MQSIDYEKQGRFKNPSDQQKLRQFIKKIKTILEFTNSDINPYFTNYGVLTKSSYRDQRIIDLKNLFGSEPFNKASPRQQYELMTKIAARQFSYASIHVNQNVKKFLNAISQRAESELDNIIQEVKPKNYISNKVPFKKEQIIAAANWWSDIIKNKLARIIAGINQTEIIPIEVTPLQERIFKTTLADSIWELCQNPYLCSDTIPLMVNYSYDVIKKALDCANIVIKNDEKLCGLTVWILQDGRVTYQYGSEVGNVYPEYYKGNLYKFVSALPEDDLIQYRDALSTITMGVHDSASDTTENSSINLYALPKEVLSDILFFAKPNRLPPEKAKAEMEWNQTRLIDLQNFFKPPAKPLSKLEKPEEIIETKPETKI